MSEKKIEMIGYLATAVLVASFAINDFLMFRIVNSIGGLLFVAYGILKKATPVTLTNLIIVALNLYYILQMSGKN